MKLSESSTKSALFPGSIDPMAWSSPTIRQASNVATIRHAPTVQDAARWLVRENAQFRVISGGREFAVKSEQDIPVGDFSIVHLWFDRWQSGPPRAPPRLRDATACRPS